MSDFDPTPLLTGVGTGVGAGILGFIGGRRQSKAQAALLEAQAVSESLAAWKETVLFQGSQIAEMRAELTKLRDEMKATRSRKAELIAYIDGAWRHYDAGGTVPYSRPRHIVAIVRPEVAEALTGEVPVIGDDHD